MEIRFDRNYGKWFLSDVRRAVRAYDMISQGERICVALSGGKDSVTLLWILAYLRRYSSLNFDLSAIHVKIQDDYSTTVLKEYCKGLGVEYFETKIETAGREPEGRVCYLCSRLKRGAMARLLKEKGIFKVAYGHQADDLAATFLMNLVVNKKAEAFSPVVKTPSGGLILIRPLIFLDEQTIARLHSRLRLPLLDFTCPYADRNVRIQYEKALSLLAGRLQVKDLSKRIAQALSQRI
jgi:tRNA(Ile)-lysidine synthase TilS/MesJ